MSGLNLAPIVLCVDGRYREPGCVLMQSLAEAHSEMVGDLRVVVVHHDLLQHDRRMLRHHADRLGLSLTLRQVDHRTGALPVGEWVSEAVYLRLQLADLLADEDHVLYVDCDTLVLGDLVPLLARRITDPLAAVLDAQNPRIGHGIALPGWQELGIERGREYFNSGVMLLNLPASREANLFGRAWQFLDQHPNAGRFWDQCALNWAAADNWIRLPYRWNTFALSTLARQSGFVHYAEEFCPLADLLAAEETASILHFAGSLKPWNNYPLGPLLDTYTRFSRSISTEESHVGVFPI
ncbi:general stress protein A [Longispora fulva]|uniref:Lipopolysaccharide biosynthesis glycosyltransferase n=1 Tax=Longispora fulva TaxID=619741 RepID=A0A8J7GGL0_9ACTN|nr:glycosyltransferase family 8 protein [Longispora fulva]MBG6136327.1 lipopolysaccharide biosynthesis glycosyltransferase [Longispora fulva]GIG63164.1 general stress protein A [Longispora fulva]